MIKYEGKSALFGITISSGGEEDPHRNYLRIGDNLFRFPAIIKPKKYAMKSKWGDVEYIARREYGFSIFQELLTIMYGPQPEYFGQISNDHCKHVIIPWKYWEFTYHRLFDLNHNEFHTEYGTHTDRESKVYHNLPKVKFHVRDYDGENVIATCYIEERRWDRGKGWFKWLKWFYKPQIQRVLDIEFDKETGSRKGSWKGGTIGTSISILPNETPLSAMIRYCIKHNMLFMEEVDD